MGLLAHTKSVEDTQALAGELSQFAQPGDILVLAGELGSGKTAFAQGFAAGLGVTEPVTSPSFVLVRSYDARVPFIHVDVYRLDHLQEAIDLGLSEALDDGGVALIEWGDVVEAMLPADFLEIRLERDRGDDDRVLRVRPVGRRWSARMAAVGRAIERWLVDEGREPGPC